ncbi:hypothetical protein ACIQWN_14620 [Streptomyces vinaceus]|uniref:hypothetical protein n=1 Tax=Streptomyces vinaceus TaxID=1960 RepID=UPI003826088D
MESLSAPARSAPARRFHRDLARRHVDPGPLARGQRPQALPVAPTRDARTGAYGPL